MPTLVPRPSSNEILVRIVIGLLRVYRYSISPILGNNCRFYPSCSCYAELAISQYGIFRGTWLALKRLSKCHPWHEGGLDPVPEQLSPH